MLRALLLCAALLLVATPVDAGAAYSARYTLGWAAPLGLGAHCFAIGSFKITDGEIKADNKEIELPELWMPETHAGGVCFRAPEGTYAVDVVDDVVGQTAYRWRTMRETIGDADQLECSSGWTKGPLAVVVAAECPRLEVQPAPGAVAGLITVASV